MQAYHACISFLDTQIAMVFDTLKEQQLWENTIIIFTSDHGYHLGDHFLWGKVTLFEIGTKVPFVIRVPGVTTAGSHSNTMVELIDIYPTLAELTNITPPTDLQGTSLVPVLNNPRRTDSKSYAYTVVKRGRHLGRAIRNQQWRYSKWPDGEELYDLERDPRERNNLANNPDYAGSLRDLRATLTTIQARAMTSQEKR